MRLALARISAFFIVAALVLWSIFLASDAPGRALSFSLLAGCAFGIVLQRGRFCFLCNLRDFVEHRDPAGILSIIIALAGGIVLYQVVLGAWVPIPQPDRLPPGAHIGPVGVVLALASLVFGIGMAISGSCLSAHFYRLGEGAFGSIAALIGAGIGFLIGFLTWNNLYTLTVYSDPAIWLPGIFGYAFTTVISLAVLAPITIFVLKRSKNDERDRGSADNISNAEAIFVKRWPPVVTGLLVAAISAFAYLRVAPLGVTAELGSLVRTAASSSSLIPETLIGLDTVRGCISAVKTALLSPNGVFVMGLVLSSFASALVAGQFKPSWPSLKGLVERFIGGVLMGWGAMTGLGCTVGVLLSGIHAGALSGWVFLVFCTAGALAGLLMISRLRKPA